MSAILHLLHPLGFGHTSARPTCTYDDIADRMNHEVTVMILLVFVIVVSTKQYVGDPIHCWVPGHFTKNYESYVNKICWVSNTYYLPIDEPVPQSTPQHKMINYYQWVPMLLLVQALMFYLPCLLWKNISNSSGIYLHDLLENSKDVRFLDKRDKVLRHLSYKIDGYLRYYQPDQETCFTKLQDLFDRCCICCRKRKGNFLIWSYIFVKLLYLANIIGQIFLMNSFLATDFHLYGFNVIKSIIQKEDSPAVTIFPRETVCDFKIRTKGSFHRYSVQCVLPINFFNEKIYICIWFWFMLMAVITQINIIVWICKILCKSNHKRMVENYLHSNDKIKPIKSNAKLLQRFMHEYLRQDGILLIRFLKLNISDIDVADLTCELWENFIKRPLHTPV